MSNNELPASVQTLFRQLVIQHGFSIGKPVSSGSFDQIMQVAEAKNLSVRFIRDRGDEFLEVGSGTEWFSLDLVRLVLLGGQPKDVPADLQQDADFLIQHFDEVELLFQTQNRSRTIKQLCDMRLAKSRCMFP